MNSHRFTRWLLTSLVLTAVMAALVGIASQRPPVQAGAMCTSDTSGSRFSTLWTYVDYKTNRFFWLDRAFDLSNDPEVTSL